MSKIIVKFIGGRIYRDFNRPFGGTPMTVHCILKAFENDLDYKIIESERNDYEVNTEKEIAKFRQGADIFHVDDTFILERM
ncbi:unnamed protein product, partial [marine sediment metagenome]